MVRYYSQSLFVNVGLRVTVECGGVVPVARAVLRNAVECEVSAARSL